MYEVLYFCSKSQLTSVIQGICFNQSLFIMGGGMDLWINLSYDFVTLSVNAMHNFLTLWVDMLDSSKLHHQKAGLVNMKTSPGSTIDFVQ